MSIDFWIGAMVLAGIYGLVALGLQLNLGITGLVNFGQAGFMAIGAYGFGLLTVQSGLPAPLAAVTGVAVAIVAAVILGLLTTRLPPDHFAVATIAFSEVVRLTLQHTSIFGGNQGIMGFDGGWRSFVAASAGRIEALGLGRHDQLPMLMAVWTAFLVALGLLVAIDHTGWGRTLRGIREDATAVAVLGRNVTLYRVLSLAISAGIASVAGIFTALNTSYLYPSLFDPAVTFLAYAVLLLGGLGRLAGVALGTLVLIVLMEASRFINLDLSAGQEASLRMLLVGLALMLICRLRPEGLIGDSRAMRAIR